MCRVSISEQEIHFLQGQSSCQFCIVKNKGVTGVYLITAVHSADITVCPANSLSHPSSGEYGANSVKINNLEGYLSSGIIFAYFERQLKLVQFDVLGVWDY